MEPPPPSAPLRVLHWLATNLILEQWMNAGKHSVHPFNICYSSKQLWCTSSSAATLKVRFSIVNTFAVGLTMFTNRNGLFKITSVYKNVNSMQFRRRFIIASVIFCYLPCFRKSLIKNVVWWQKVKIWIFITFISSLTIKAMAQTTHRKQLLELVELFANKSCKHVCVWPEMVIWNRCGWEPQKCLLLKIAPLIKLIFTRHDQADCWCKNE